MGRADVRKYGLPHLEISASYGRYERAAIGGEAGFAPVQLVRRCDDCLQNELAEPSDPEPDTARGRHMGHRRYYNCPTCLGFGVMPASVIDPYMLPRKGRDSQDPKNSPTHGENRRASPNPRGACHLLVGPLSEQHQQSQLRASQLRLN
jgi:hypothetical protein